MDNTETTLKAAIKAMTDSVSGWDGRVEGFTETITEICEHYAERFDVDPVKIFGILEERRTYSYPNYYQWAKFPRLDDVVVCETMEELKVKIMPKQGFRCPACGGVSKDPYECDTGIQKDGEPCNWKSYGLFRTMGKGLRVIVKDTFLENPVVDEIFFPIALEKQTTSAVVKNG